MRFYDTDERRRQQPAGAVLDAIGVGPGAVVADIGAGDGYFALPLARRVGPTGLVYAVDPSVERLERLRERAGTEGLEHLRILNRTAEEPPLCEGCLDLVFFGICLHDFADPAVALQNAMIALKPGGRLANLDWRKEETEGRGPPVTIRFSEEEAGQMLREAGFVIEACAPSGPHHYLILARRP